MARVALVDPVLFATNPASFARGRDYHLFQEDGKTLASIFDAKSEGSTVAQPLLTNAGGLPLRSSDEALCWVEAGSYVREVDGVQQPVEMPSGSGGTGAVASVNGHTGAVVLSHSDVGADAEGAAAAAAAASQPLDSDLSAIAAITTTAWGRSLLTVEGAQAAGSILGIPCLSAKWFGAIGNGTTDDTGALKSAITAAISAKLPLYLPPGTYKITSGLTATSSDFCVFGAGARLSVLEPSSNEFDALTIGPGSEGSGPAPSGYLRDLGIEGGGEGAECTKAGVASTSGKAALKLDGIRQFDVSNVIIDGETDIGVDLINNCYGCTFHNVRVQFNATRVALNIRDGDESGSDLTFYNCWLAGEVAAVHIAGSGGGYHFYGGQMSSSNQSTADEDGRGTVIIGKDYLSGATGGAYNVTLNGIDFEGAQKCWMIRGFSEFTMSLQDVALNANGGSAMIGLFKFTTAGSFKLNLQNVRPAGTFTNKGEGLIVVEGGGSSREISEMGTSGQVTANSVAVNLYDEALCILTKQEHANGFSKQGVFWEETLFKNEGHLPLYSVDWGANWTYFGPAFQEVASASTVTIVRGVTVVKITGTTEIKKINATVKGHVINVIFASSASIKRGENLKLNVEKITGAANTTVELTCDGTNWIQSGAALTNS